MRGVTGVFAGTVRVVIEGESCPGCGVVIPAQDGPSHDYMTGSPACWAAYGRLLATQYSDPQRMSFHQLVVDTYAVQHPGGHNPRAVQSVGIHRMTLCLFLEHETDPVHGTRLHRLMVNLPVFQRLEPPEDRGRLTCVDVAIDAPVDVARAAAYAWAEEVWSAWAAHHDTVRGWLQTSGLAAGELS